MLYACVVNFVVTENLKKLNKAKWSRVLQVADAATAEHRQGYLVLTPKDLDPFISYV